MSSTEEHQRRLKVLHDLHEALKKRDIVRTCPKCGRTEADIPCAYPDFNYRDCPLKTIMRL